MKKTILYLCLAAGLLSCAKEPAPQEETKGVPMTFEISVAGTKAGGIAKQSWADGDAICVFIVGIPEKYLVLSYDGSCWRTFPVGGDITDDEIDNLGENYSLTAVYFPVSVGIAYEDNGEDAKNKFSFKNDGKPVYGSYYLYDEKDTFTVEGTTVKAILTMQIPEGMVQLYFPGGEGKESLDDFTFSCPMIRPVACVAVGLDGTIQESVLQRGARVGGGMPYGQGAIFAGRYDNPDETAKHTFSLTNASEIWTISVDRETPLEGGKLYTFPNFPEDGWYIELAHNQYVDLGLPSGTKWATCNLGAAYPEDYGDYFAWGELQPKGNYGWDTYEWMQEGQSDEGHITKYTVADGQTDCIWYDGGTFVGDGKTSLQDYDNVDDAAYAALGGKFRMPTDADWEELLDKCTKEWKTMVNGYAHNGYLFTGPNNNTLFLPAAGGRHDTSLEGAGSSGIYWSSSLDEYSSAYAKSVFSWSESVYRYSDYRFYGFSVRPVYHD